MKERRSGRKAEELKGIMRRLIGCSVGVYLTSLLPELRIRGGRDVFCYLQNRTTIDPSCKRHSLVGIAEKRSSFPTGSRTRKTYGYRKQEAQSETKCA